MAEDEYVRVTDDDYLEVRKKLGVESYQSDRGNTVLLTSHGFSDIPNTDRLAISMTVIKRKQKKGSW